MSSDNGVPGQNAGAALLTLSAPGLRVKAAGRIHRHTSWNDQSAAHGHLGIDEGDGLCLQAGCNVDAIPTGSNIITTPRITPVKFVQLVCLRIAVSSSGRHVHAGYLTAVGHTRAKGKGKVIRSGKDFVEILQAGFPINALHKLAIRRGYDKSIVGAGSKNLSFMSHSPLTCRPRRFSKKRSAFHPWRGGHKITCRGNLPKRCMQ
jgi:hypothetical protein